VTLTLTLDPAIQHTVVHHSSTSTYVPNFIEIEETFCGRTDGHFPPPLILLGRLLEVDLKTQCMSRDSIPQINFLSQRWVICQILSPQTAPAMFPSTDYRSFCICDFPVNYLHWYW